MKSEKLKVKSAQIRRRSLVVFLSLFIFHFSLVSCGFHLRGTGKFEISSKIPALEVRVQNNFLENHPLLMEMLHALRTQTDIQLQQPGAPLLVLYDERSESQVLSVSSTVKVEEFLLSYQVSFRLEERGGRALMPPQTVMVRRDHRFDRLNVLAKEREEHELRNEMRREAVQQILRRLARVTPEPPHAAEP